MDRAATIYDVARQAGVSHQTVSRVLNNAPGVSVRARNLVHIASEELGFVANRAARNLRTARTVDRGLVLVADCDGTCTFASEVVHALRSDGVALLLEVVLPTERDEVETAIARLRTHGAGEVFVLRDGVLGPARPAMPRADETSPIASHAPVGCATGLLDGKADDVAGAAVDESFGPACPWPVRGQWTSSGRG